MATNCDRGETGEMCRVLLGTIVDFADDLKKYLRDEHGIKVEWRGEAYRFSGESVKMQ